MFGDNKIMEVVNLVWTNRAKIMHIIENLPEALEKTGNSIESAGNSAVRAGRFFGGGDKRKAEVNASELSEKAARALQRCQREINDAAKMMSTVGKELDDVWIPSVKPKYLEVLGTKVVSGLDIGENKLLGNVATRLTDGSQNLSTLGDEMRDIAASLRELSGVLKDAGGDLVSVGEQLVDSGQFLTKMSDLEGIVDVLDGDD